MPLTTILIRLQYLIILAGSIVFSFPVTFPAFAQDTQERISADPDSSHPPPVFQPDEIQHGFSEFDSLPEIPSDDIPSTSPESSPVNEASFPGNPDKPPGGLFFRLQFAEGFEEEQGLRRGHMMVPVNPKNVFPPDTRAVFLVFSVFKHYAPYQVFGRLYPVEVDRANPSDLLDEDTMYIAAEDDSGYLQFFPKSGQWTPGTYKVKIYVGYQASDFNHMGTMRFTIASNGSPPPASRE